MNVSKEADRQFKAELQTADPERYTRMAGLTVRDVLADESNRTLGVVMGLLARSFATPQPPEELERRTRNILDRMLKYPKEIRGQT